MVPGVVNMLLSSMSTGRREDGATVSNRVFSTPSASGESSTRMNISSTCAAKEKMSGGEKKHSPERRATSWRLRARPYLVVLHQAEQHGHHHLLLGVQLLACVRLVGAPQHKQIVDYRLQGRDGCGGRRNI
ncbi:hypothetical protein EYF80_045563 [Liparis tanakae]|uniref:Uncharacterized protein n=1 Tax=Liparis tanakae TaxID=230148 RepID=A0A4Z2FTS6_9TELE|nr:hypothetical protein EYF80_045563 [Liparis tanakae]